MSISSLYRMTRKGPPTLGMYVNGLPVLFRNNSIVIGCRVDVRKRSPPSDRSMDKETPFEKMSLNDKMNTIYQLLQGLRDGSDRT